jgi:cell division protein FtsZ
MDNALAGVEELKKSVDAIITIPNDKIRQVVPKGTSFADSLKVADEVLRQGIRGIAELIVKPSLINLDFADVKTTLKGRGVAHMGIGVAKGEKRISDAVRCAVCSPLLNTTIEGASSVILNIIGGKDLSLDKVVMAADLVKGVVDYSANVIFGACIDESMSDEVEVVIIATGFNNDQNNFTPASQENAMRQASALSQKIDYAYNDKTSAPTQEPFTFAMPQPVQAVQPTQAPQQYVPIEPIQPMQPMQQTPSFEPGDPISDNAQDEDSFDRKHRPRFVDFFMKRNGDDK